MRLLSLFNMYRTITEAFLEYWKTSSVKFFGNWRLEGGFFEVIKLNHCNSVDRVHTSFIDSALK